MIGLKKRPTYDELVSSLDMDPIKHYPDRRATEFENSNYMSTCLRLSRSNYSKR